jgi:hypothetical protein
MISGGEAWGFFLPWRSSEQRLSATGISKGEMTHGRNMSACTNCLAIISPMSHTVHATRFGTRKPEEATPFYQMRKSITRSGRPVNTHSMNGFHWAAGIRPNPHNIRNQTSLCCTLGDFNTNSCRSVVKGEARECSTAYPLIHSFYKFSLESLFPTGIGVSRYRATASG